MVALRGLDCLLDDRLALFHGWGLLLICQLAVDLVTLDFFFVDGGVGDCLSWFGFLRSLWSTFFLLHFNFSILDAHVRVGYQVFLSLQFFILSLSLFIFGFLVNLSLQNRDFFCKTLLIGKGNTI